MLFMSSANVSKILVSYGISTSYCSKYSIIEVWLSLGKHLVGIMETLWWELIKRLWWDVLGFLHESQMCYTQIHQPPTSSTPTCRTLRYELALNVGIGCKLWGQNHSTLKAWLYLLLTLAKMNLVFKENALLVCYSRFKRNQKQSFPPINRVRVAIKPH